MDIIRIINEDILTHPTFAKVKDKFEIEVTYGTIKTEVGNMVVKLLCAAVNGCVELFTIHDVMKDHHQPGRGYQTSIMTNNERCISLTAGTGSYSTYDVIKHIDTGIDTGSVTVMISNELTGVTLSHESFNEIIKYKHIDHWSLGAYDHGESDYLTVIGWVRAQQLCEMIYIF